MAPANLTTLATTGKKRSHDTASSIALPQLPPSRLRGMWELSSVINFFNVFHPVLKFGFDFSIEELESALISPNSTLDDIHMVLLKAIPPVSKCQSGHDAWVTVLCKKLKDWWPWVADGPFPLIQYEGGEVVTYKELDPETRVIILKALCEVRLDQDDLRTYIDESLKKGVSLSTFRKEEVGVDMQGTTYWYENDFIAGVRFYREVRNADNKVNLKNWGKTVPPPTFPWETVATNLEEFQVVAGKLASSRNRLEAGIGKRITADIIPELEDIQKKKERALKKQQRQAFLLNTYLNVAASAAGRPRRELKAVTYTYDDYDRSIAEAIEIYGRQSSLQEVARDDSITTHGSIENAVNDDLSEDADHQLELDHQLKKTQGSHLSHIELIPQKQSGSSGYNGRHTNSGEDFVKVEWDGSSDDEKRHTVHKDGHMEKGKRGKPPSFVGNEDRQVDQEIKNEDDDAMDCKNDGDCIQMQQGQKYGVKSKRKCVEVKLTDSDLRHSKRVTRSNVDCNKHEDLVRGQ